MFKRTFFAACMALSFPALALDLSVQGVGVAPIGKDIALTRGESLANAKRDAMIAIINKINGANAARDPKVQEKIEGLVKQLPSTAITGQTAKKSSANDLETTITLTVEDSWIRKLLNDEGLNLNTAGYKILILIDEYHTTPLDRQKPLREVVEYSHDKTATSASASESASQSSSFAAAESKTAVVGRSDSVAMVETRHGAAAAGRTTQVAGKSSSSEVAASESASASSAASFDQKKDVVSFKKLVEYLPRNVGPEKTSGTYTALVREAGKYDLELLDADNFKLSVSAKPFSIDDLEKSGNNDAMMAKAKGDPFNADYFMKGTVYVLDTGKRNGESTCDGVVSLKAFAVEESTLLVADSQTESAVGNSPEQCANAVGNKLANFVGAKVGAKVRDYAKNAVMNGKVYSISLVSNKGPLGQRVLGRFEEALKSVKGITSGVTNRGKGQYSVKYASPDSFATALLKAMDKQTGFDDADILTVSGTTLKVCMESPCQ